MTRTAPKLRSHTAYRLLVWAWPSLLLAFAVPGCLLLVASANVGGDVVLSAKAVAALQQLGLCALAGSIAGRILFAPPRAVRRFIKGQYYS
ncbi:hypothetical protein [Luteimonas sp. MHLX1A]|uniref:hypothetical protein n=1 Tax=Alterluteimonas muca TaxID=2878684 RepID=UPI001E61D39B|nr:hypothetical protein [Luteimonas sp. MHLX1A]MCD9046910.1 hypothetical protein [Luteimonas sp. MHLX1A]